MERFDVKENDRLAEMVTAARAGVDVKITADGVIVAQIVASTATERTGGQDFLDRLAVVHRMLPSEIMGGNAAAEVRAMRDEDW